MMNMRLPLSPIEPPQPSRSQTSLVHGASLAFQRTLDQIEMVAPRNTTVLLLGETGSGKEVAAREVHRASGRPEPMISVNCAGVPAQLLEAEFFGHERGAFTDAGQARPGLFEKANGGTLFLDEIGEMPLALQPKLLRALQEGEITRLGGAAPRRIDVRVIAATNRDLWEQVQAREFREDLYYRINVFPIRLPALRERPEDIAALLRHFIAMFCKRDGLRAKVLDEDALRSLRTRHWPGNVRELRNAVELAVIRSGHEPLVRLEHFPTCRKAPQRAAEMVAGPPPDGVSGRGLSEMVAHYERDLIRRTLDRTQGNKSQAAAELQIKRTTLVEKIKRFERDGLLAAS